MGANAAPARASSRSAPGSRTPTPPSRPAPPFAGDDEALVVESEGEVRGPMHAPPREHVRV